jgi:hypothetical protein
MVGMWRAGRSGGIDPLGICPTVSSLGLHSRAVSSAFSLYYFGQPPLPLATVYFHPSFTLLPKNSTREERFPVLSFLSGLSGPLLVALPAWSDLVVLISQFGDQALATVETVTLAPKEIMQSL